MTESTVTLDEALKLLALPRELGAHPDRQQPIVAGLGRFGPYVKHGDDFRRSSADDDVFTVGARSRRWRCSPRRSSRGRRQTARRVIRQIEATDGGNALQVLEGRYGPYVTDGETNASMPKAPIPPTLTLDEARALLEARRSAPPRAERAAAGAARQATRAAATPRGRSSEPAGAKVSARTRRQTEADQAQDAPH